MSSSSQKLPRIYSLEEIEKVVSTPDFRNKLIDGIKEGFVALAKGEFFAAPIQTLGLPPFPFLEVDDYAAQTCVKSGYFKGHGHYVIKVRCGIQVGCGWKQDARNQAVHTDCRTRLLREILLIRNGRKSIGR